MEKKHPKHRKITKAIISHPLYQKKKANSKFPQRFDMWEDSVVGGLHIFEWIVVGLVSLVVIGIVASAISGFAGRPPVGCSTCNPPISSGL